MAEAFTNAHAFVIIACNHSGKDMWRYETSCKPYSAEWFLRCAYSSTNFECGNDFIDVTYGWLNYQIEHHMFPDMTPLQYRKLQPLIKSACKKHGVQYIQENALKRTWKMLRVAVGADRMQRCVSLLPAQESDNKRKSPCPGNEGSEHQPKKARTIPATSEPQHADSCMGA
jgi:fatty acid desaturase